MILRGSTRTLLRLSFSGLPKMRMGRHCQTHIFTATGIELDEHILLRVNKAERRAVGLTIFDYSVLAQPTELGPRSLPLA